MDFDLLSNILRDLQPALKGNLLQNLPVRLLTLDQCPTERNGIKADEARRDIPAANATVGGHNQSGAVISKIEDIFESIANGILNQKQELSIRLKSRQKPGTQDTKTQTAAAKDLYDVRYPSRSPQEAWKFSEFMTVQYTTLTSAQ